MSALLFIGGPADGERIEVPATTYYWRVSYVLPLGSRISHEQEEHIPHAEYFRIVTNGEDVMLLSGLDPQDLISFLLASYHPGVAVEIGSSLIAKNETALTEENRAKCHGGKPHLVIWKLPYDA